MTLTTQQQMLIEQRVTNEAKSTGAAYLIWLFLGGLGGHRFYLGRGGSGAVMLILTIVGALTLVVGIGAVFLIIVGIWALIDAFLIPGMIQAHKDKIRQSLSMNAMMAVGAARQEPQM